MQIIFNFIIPEFGKCILSKGFSQYSLLLLNAKVNVDFWIFMIYIEFFNQDSFEKASKTIGIMQVDQ